LCLPTALALPLHSNGDFGSPVIGSSARCYKGTMTIKSPRWHIRFPRRSPFDCFIVRDEARRVAAFVALGAKLAFAER